MILRLKCIKFTFCWGSAPEPTGRAYIAPQTKGPTSKRREVGRGGKRGDEVKGQER